MTVGGFGEASSPLIAAGSHLLCTSTCPSVLSLWREDGGGSDALAAAVPPCVRLPAQPVLHLLEVHVGYGDGRRAFLLEAGLEVEGHQEVLADEEGAAEARHAAQVLQVAPQEDGALALLAAVAVHRQHVDVHCGGVWDVLSHGFLEITQKNQGC